MHDRNMTLKRRVDTADWAGVLVGLGGAWLGHGLVRHFFHVLDPTPTTWRLVLGATFAALAVGLLVPHGAAAWVAARCTPRRHRRLPVDLPYAAFLPAEKDRALHRVVLAGLALVAGGTSLLALGWLHLLSFLHETLLQRFLWTPGALLAVEAGLVAAAALWVFVPVGLCWSCVQHLACPVGGWRVRPLAGIAAGLAAATVVASRPLAAEVFLLAGAVPFFALAVVAVRLAWPADGIPDADAEAHRGIPQAAGREARVMRVTMLGVLACAALTAAVSWRASAILAGAEGAGGPAALASWGFGFAVGVAWACGRAERRVASLAGLGWACARAGVVLAFAAGGLGAWGYGAYEWSGRVVGLCALTGCVVGLPAAAIGYAFTYGYQAALARTGHGSAAGPALISQAMLAIAGVLVAATTPLVRTVGTYAALVAVSLVLLGWGGALMIHGNTEAPRVRRLRIGAVFGAVAAMIVVLPYAGRSWLTTRPWKRLALIEHAWCTQSIWAADGELRRVAEPADRAPPLAPRRLAATPEGPHVRGAWRSARRSLAVAVLGNVPASLSEGLASAELKCERVLFDPTALRHDTFRDDGTVIRAEPATQFLRRTANRYDAIIIGMGDRSPTSWTPTWHTVVMARALDRLQVDGLMLLVLPLTQTSAGELHRCLAGMPASAEPDFSWSVTEQGSERTLWLAFGKDGQWRERWRDALPWVDRTPRELADALGPASPLAAEDSAPPAPLG